MRDVHAAMGGHKGMGCGAATIGASGVVNTAGSRSTVACLTCRPTSASPSADAVHMRTPKNNLFSWYAQMPHLQAH